MLNRMIVASWLVLIADASAIEKAIWSPDHAQCLETMLLGPQRKDLKVYGNRVNCNRTEARLGRDGSIRISGRIDHRRTLGADPYWHFVLFIEPDGAIRRTEADFYFPLRGDSYEADQAMVYVMKGFPSSSEAQAWLVNPEARESPENIFTHSFLYPPPDEWATVYLFQDFAALIARSRFNAAQNKRDGQIEWYVERRGQTIAQAPIVGSPSACKARCDDNARCKAWTYLTASPDIDSPQCRLVADLKKGAFSFSHFAASGLKPLGRRPLTDPVADPLTEDVRRIDTEQ